MGFLGGLMSDMMKESTGYDLGKVARLVGKKNLLMLGAGAALAGGVAGSMNQGQQGPSTGPSSWGAPQGPPRAPSPTPATPSPGQGASPPPPPPIPSAATAPSAPTDSATAGPPPPPPIPSAAVAPTTSPAAVASNPEAPIESPIESPVESPVETPGPADVEAIISPELTFALVRTMVAAALADGNLDDREKEMIHERLGTSDLPADRVQQIHRDLVIPPTPAELAHLTDERVEHEAMYRFAALLILADEEVSELERSWLDRLAVAFGFEGDAKSALEAEIFA